MASKTNSKTVVTPARGSSKAPVGKGKIVVARPKRRFSSERELVESFSAANKNVAGTVAEFIMSAAEYMERCSMSVKAMQEVLKKGTEGALKYSHAEHLPTAAFIYSFSGGTDPLHILRADGSTVITMAARIRKQYGAEDAVSKIRELVALGLPFHEWGSAKYADGSPMVRASGAKKDDGTKPKADPKPKGDKADKAATVATFDEFIVAAARWLDLHKDERKTTQPELVAYVAAALESVTVTE